MKNLLFGAILLLGVVLCSCKHEKMEMEEINSVDTTTLDLDTTAVLSDKVKVNQEVEKGIPKFTGIVDESSDAMVDKFHSFISVNEHEKKVFYLDVSFSKEQIYFEDHSITVSFVTGDFGSDHYGGMELNFVGKHSRYFSKDTRSLIGYFKVSEFGGLNQGILSYVLEPVSIGNVR